jgi:hypothetical protein
MKRGYFFPVALAILILFALTTTINAEPNIIDNIQIKAIKSMESYKKEKQYFLKVIAKIENLNEKNDVRFRKGEYQFMIGAKSCRKKNVDDHGCPLHPKCSDIPLKLLGVAQEKEIILPKNSASDEENATEVSFHVNLGNNAGDAMEAMSQMINCTADRENYRPYLHVNAQFELGVKSDKGWSMTDARIEWEFIPKPPSQIDFLTAGNQ